ncbi:Uncharacterised protein [Yersinia enterocolitica]|nr:Uncharacterised protein [Yersinia enterocolitica]
MVTIGQFLFSFWLVKGMTVTYGNTRNGKGHKTKELRDNIPDVLLRVNNILHVKGASLRHYAHQG